MIGGRSEVNFFIIRALTDKERLSYVLMFNCTDPFVLPALIEPKPLMFTQAWLRGKFRDRIHFSVTKLDSAAESNNARNC